MVERYSFVAITTADLRRARSFWVDALGFAVTEEKPGEFFIVDAGGLRLCIDGADGGIHRSGSSDPVIGFRVASVRKVLEELDMRDVPADRSLTPGRVGEYAEIRDPDGRTVILTESD